MKIIALRHRSRRLDVDALCTRSRLHRGPRAQWTQGYPSNGYGSTIDSTVFGKIDGGKYGYGPTGAINIIKANLATKGNQKLYSSEVDPDCGLTTFKDAARSKLPASQLEYTGFTHPGPCEVWCDNTKVLFDYDCQTKYAGSPAKIPYDESKCVNANRLTIYWLAVHGEQWQVYSDCVWLEGGSGKGAPPSTVGAGASTVAAGSSSSSTQTTTPTPASNASPSTNSTSPSSSTTSTATTAPTTDSEEIGNEASTSSGETPTTEETTPTTEETTPSPEETTPATEPLALPHFHHSEVCPPPVDMEMSRLSTFAASAVPPVSNPKTGYSNLFNHAMKVHPDYLSTMKMSGFNSGTLVTFIDQKSQTTIYSWLVLIIEYNLPYADLVTKTVEATLSEVPPSMFGIIIDGRTFLSEHFVAIFAVFDHDDRVEKVPLAMAPIGVLPFYKRDTSNISYLVGDNCSVNTKLADLLEVSFIGSASHRLDLAVNLFLSEYEPQLEQVQQLMQKLRGLNKAAKLL
ncbi:hypothetical protein GQ600_15448 [Phytophthora cactorum]|nr:hypothetical protein GQ600_15448 [Phytophthora cactorum]